MDFKGAMDAFKPRQPNHQAVAVDHASIISVFRSFVEDRYLEYKRQLTTYQRAYLECRARGTARDLRLAKAYKDKFLKTQRDIKMLRQRWSKGEGDALSGFSVGIEAYLTRLHSLTGYQRIWGEPRPKRTSYFTPVNAPYIIGRTTKVTIKDDQNESWDLGEYDIYIPLSGTISDIHWIPLRKPDEYYRHPHHTRGHDGEAITCWGSFAGYVATCLEEGDFIPLLALSGQFAHSYNPDSPLALLSQISFAKPV